MGRIRAQIAVVSSETVHPDRYKCPSRWEGARERLLSVGSFITLHIHILVPFLSAFKQLGHQVRWQSHNGKLADVNRQHTYLIFVNFFTQAKFLENKIYTEKRQFFALNL